MNIVVDILENYAEEAKKEGNVFRQRAYKKAITDYIYGRPLTQHMQDKIKGIIDSYKKTIGLTREQVLHIVKHYFNIINRHCKIVQVTGSFRRGKKYMRDIDLLIISNQQQSEDIVDIIEKDPWFIKKLYGGKRKYTFVSNITKDPGKKLAQIDIRFFRPEEHAYGLIYFTGNANFSIMTRQIAKKRGFKLNEYGIYSRKTGKKIPIKNTELDVLKFLNLENYIDPKTREI